jgi:hypothetical protein
MTCLFKHTQVVQPEQQLDHPPRRKEDLQQLFTGTARRYGAPGAVCLRRAGAVQGFAPVQSPSVGLASVSACVEWTHDNRLKLLQQQDEV